MLFNSYVFIFLFLPFTLSGYFFINRFNHNSSKIFLLLASLFFYSWWDIRYLPLLLFSIIVNFLIANKLFKLKNKKVYFIGAILLNVVLLFYFKYVDFFISNINYLSKSDIELLNIVLPLGISFFTLQQIAFLVDHYQGITKEENFIDYALFVSFFPQLIAGPIVHHKEMVPQFANENNKFLNYENISKGLFIFSIGLFKKVVLADNFGVLVDNGYSNVDSLNLVESWILSFSYMFQLYFDFSGYIDMATGIALMFNIKLPINFNSPLKSKSIIEFWQRWHITLSNFITSYLFVPLVKLFKKPTFSSMMLAIFIATLISGLWHGAKWTFVIYGGLHGVALVINHLYKKYKLKMNNFMAWLITINFVNISFIFFRSDNCSEAINIIRTMFGMGDIVLPGFLYDKVTFLSDYGIKWGNMVADIKGDILMTPLMILIGFLIIMYKDNSNQLTVNLTPTKRNVIFSSLLFLIAILSINRVDTFIYFQF